MSDNQVETSRVLDQREASFFEKVNKTDSCWFWTGSLDTSGYGNFWNGVKLVGAHRWAYEHWKGPIDKLFQIDHICRNRNCVNPEHLRTETSRGNTFAEGSKAPAAINKNKTHCKRGHPFTPENTYLARARSGSLRRQCKQCVLDYARWRRKS